MALESALLDGLAARLEPVGLNLIGVAEVRAYDARVPARLRLGPRWPWARSAIVVGSGGPAFWNAFVAGGRAAAASAHPLDAFAERCFEERALELLGDLEPVAVYPHDASPVSFVHLAESAGLGVRSLLGVLIRPDFGPWFALRAAALVSAELPPSAPLAFDPCPSCAKPCVTACPAAAVRGSSGWDVPSCAAHRLAAGDCGDGCHSRLACVYGQEHRYPIEAMRHHQSYALGAMSLLRPAAPGSAAPG